MPLAAQGGRPRPSRRWQNCQKVRSATADIYDVATNSISPTTSFSNGRAGHSLTLLSNGNVLLAGGVVSGLFMIPTATNNCQTWSPASGAWSSTGSLVDSRGMHTAAVLENGNTIVVGGLAGTFLAIAATSTVEEHTGVSASSRAAIGTNPGIAGATSPGCRPTRSSSSWARRVLGTHRQKHSIRREGSWSS